MVTDVEALELKCESEGPGSVLNMIVLRFAKEKKPRLSVAEICNGTNLDLSVVENILNENIETGLFDKKDSEKETDASFVFCGNKRKWLIEDHINNDIAQLENIPEFRQAAQIYAAAIANANAVSANALADFGKRIAYYDYILQEYEAKSWDIERSDKTLLENLAILCAVSEDNPHNWLEGIMRSVLKNYAPQMVSYKESKTGPVLTKNVPTGEFVRELFDNTMRPDDRTLIYDMLIPEGLADGSRQEFNLIDGKEGWRHYTYQIDEKKICSYVDIENVWRDALSKPSLQRIVISIIENNPAPADDKNMKKKLLGWGLIKKVDVYPGFKTDEEDVNEGADKDVRHKLSPKILKYSPDITKYVLEKLGEANLAEYLEKHDFDISELNELGIRTKGNLQDILSEVQDKPNAVLPVFFKPDFAKVTADILNEIIPEIYGMQLVQPSKEQLGRVNEKYGEEISKLVLRYFKKFGVPPDLENHDELVKKAEERASRYFALNRGKHFEKGSPLMCSTAVFLTLKYDNASDISLDKAAEKADFEKKAMSGKLKLLMLSEGIKFADLTSKIEEPKKDEKTPILPPVSEKLNADDTQKIEIFVKSSCESLGIKHNLDAIAKKCSDRIVRFRKSQNSNAYFFRGLNGLAGAAIFLTLPNYGIYIPRKKISDAMKVDDTSVAVKAELLANLAGINIHEIIKRTSIGTPEIKEEIKPEPIKPPEHEPPLKISVDVIEAPKKTEQQPEPAENLIKLSATKEERLKIYADIALAVKAAKIDITNRKAVLDYITGIYKESGRKDPNNQANQFWDQFRGDRNAFNKLSDGGNLENIRKYLPRDAGKTLDDITDVSKKTIQLPKPAENLNKLSITEKERFEMAKESIPTLYKADIAAAIKEAKIDIKDRKASNIFIYTIYHNAGIAEDAAQNRAYQVLHSIKTEKDLQQLAKKGNLDNIKKYLPKGAESLEGVTEEPAKKAPKAPPMPYAKRQAPTGDAGIMPRKGHEESYQDNLKYISKTLPYLIERNLINAASIKRHCGALAALRQDIEQGAEYNITEQRKALECQQQSLKSDLARQKRENDERIKAVEAKEKELKALEDALGKK